MNKLTIDKVHHVVEKTKLCVMGKIASDINSRLPEKPEEWDNLEMYNFIKNGTATLNTLSIRDIMESSNYATPKLFASYTYPVKPEMKVYEDALEKVKDERNMREQAVSLAFDRLANERIFELIDGKEFLDKLEQLSQEDW